MANSQGFTRDETRENGRKAHNALFRVQDALDDAALVVPAFIELLEGSRGALSDRHAFLLDRAYRFERALRDVTSGR